MPNLTQAHATGRTPDRHALHRRRRLHLSAIHRGGLSGLDRRRHRNRSGGDRDGARSARPAGDVPDSIVQPGRAHVPAEWNDPKHYDFIYGDAFNDLSIPYHLTTVEFNRIVAIAAEARRHLSLRTSSTSSRGESFSGLRPTPCARSFPTSTSSAAAREFLPFDRNTYVLMASRATAEPRRLDAITARDDPSSRTTPLSVDRMNVYVTSGRAITLTDDFVPVDQLLARLFVERGN